MFRYLISLALIAFEVMCCKIFFESFSDEGKERKAWEKNILLIAQTCMIYICALLLSQWLILKQAAVILVIVVFMSLYLGIRLKKSIVLALLYQGLLLIVDYCIYIGNIVFFSIEGEAKTEYAVEGNLLILFGKIITFVCILLLKKQFGKKSAKNLMDSEWIRFFFFPMFTIITIVAMIINFPYAENQMQADVLYVIAFGMVVMNLFVYYMINDIIEREAKLHEKELLELQVKNQMAMYRSISENYESQKQRAHEFKNQILCIEGLINDKEYDKAGKYVKNISESFIGESNAINTNHVIVNAILNSKYQEAVNKNIVFAFRVNDLSYISMADEDVVILLANLLNNAIEACEKCIKNRIIKLKFMVEGGAVILSVKNTYSQALIYDNNEIRTSKSINKEEHGIGIKNIIRIIEKYDGEYAIQHSGDEFYFSIMLPI